MACNYTNSEFMLFKPVLLNQATSAHLVSTHRYDQELGQYTCGEIGYSNIGGPMAQSVYIVNLAQHAITTERYTNTNI